MAIDLPNCLVSSGQKKHIIPLVLEFSLILFFLFLQLVNAILWEQWVDGATRHQVSVCAAKE